MSGLPDGWEICPLAEVVDICDSDRVPLNATERSVRQGPYPYFGANGQVDSIDDYRYEGDFVLVAEDGGYFDDPRRGVAYEVSGRFWVNNHAHVLRGGELLTNRFLSHALNRVDWMQFVTGSTRLKLTQGALRRVPLPVPPLETQHHIVAALDAIHARTRAAREALEAIPPLVDKFRQSVLAAAFRGDLTADWRAANPDVEPASELLKRIRVERRERWIADYADKHRTRAEQRVLKAGKPWGEAESAKTLAEGVKKGAAVYVEPEPVDAEAEGLPELPGTWCWARLEELVPPEAPVVYGIIQPGPHVEDGVPYIRPADIDDSSVDIDRLPRTSRDIAEQYERAKLTAGDLVYSVVGTIGKWLVVPSELAGANITQSSVRIRTEAPLSAIRVLRMLQAPAVETQIARTMFGNAVQRLNVAHVRELAVPLAPAAEQKPLEAAIESALATLRRQAATATACASQLAALERAALAKAFRGELVR